MTHRTRAAVLAVVAVLAVPVLASAAHWPNFGGDAGHSGYQPIAEARMPTQLKWSATDSGAVRNSIVTTAGPAEANRFLAYGKQEEVAGTSNDRADVHLRSLADGAEKIARAAQDVDDGSDDPDAFGPGNAGTGVSFVDSSAAAGPGQLYVVHNDTDSVARNEATCPTAPDRRASTNDIAIAQFDEATGAKKLDVAVGPANELADVSACPPGNQVSNGYTVRSSPVITPPLDSEGTRWIFFLAEGDPPAPPGGTTPAPRLFGVRIEKAGRPDAVVHADTPQHVDVPGANTLASPSIAYLGDIDRGGVSPFVVVPTSTTTSSAIRSFRVGLLSDPGPTASVDVAGTPQTVSVPVAANGMLPGQAGSGVEKAPALFVPYASADGTTTTVRKFGQAGENTTLTPQGASTVDGSPSTALAITGTAQAARRVVVATGRNLHLLDAADLSVDERYRDSGESALTPGDSGFSRNVPAASGGFVFITNDVGAQFVLREADGERVPTGEFSEAPANRASTFGLGQPSYTDGNLQFLSDAGVFVYRTAVDTAAPTAVLSLSPNPARTGEPVTFDGTGSSDPDGRIVKYEWDIGDGNFVAREAKFSFAYPQGGTFRVRLRVTDNHGATAVAEQNLVVSPNQAPTASFVVGPNPARTTSRVSFDARGSRDPDGRITRYEWDLDGDGTFETDRGSEPTTSRVYTAPGIYNVRLRVTDDRGATGETVRQLAVTRPARREPRLSARVRPRHDPELPYTFTTRGLLDLPSGVRKADGCRGRVVVIVKSGKNTISRRVTSVNKETCRYRSKVTFDERDRLDGRDTLRFKTRFQGNAFLLPKSAKTRTVRIG